MSVLLNKMIVLAVLSLGLPFMLSGCAPSRQITIDGESHKAQIQSDMIEIYKNYDVTEVVNLSLDESIDSALRNNLDARVSTIENLIARDNISLAQIQAIPNTKISGTYTRRNNSAASSSQSIITGTQSLEPSTSSDQSRYLADVETQWNIMDAVIAYLDGKIASDNELITQERLKKIKHNIEMDTVNAYWRAYAIQQSEKNYIGLLKHDKILQTNLDKAYKEGIMSVEAVNEKQKTILDQTRSVVNLFEDTSVASVELKNLMAMPTEQKINLTTNPKDVMGQYQKYNNLPTTSMVQIALLNRPELREIYIDYNASVKNIQKELISTFPGLNIIYSRNYDSNSFLEDSSWINFSTALTQSITDFITLPTRYRAARNKEKLQEERRKALTATIIAQVYLGRMRVNLAKENYDFALKNEKIIKRQASAAISKMDLGVSSGYDGYMAKSGAVEAMIEKNIAFAELQRAYVDLYRTLGVSLSEEVGAS